MDTFDYVAVAKTSSDKPINSGTTKLSDETEGTGYCAAYGGEVPNDLAATMDEASVKTDESLESVFSYNLVNTMGTKVP